VKDGRGARWLGRLFYREEKYVIITEKFPAKELIHEIPL
jgi:hypothetical protein